MEMRKAPHFHVTLKHSDRNQAVDEAKKVVVQLRPDWKIEDLKFQFFTDGLTNTLFSLWSEKTGPGDRILFRIYGEKTEIVIDRNAEKRNMVLLHKHGCSAPLYGTFDNGVIYGYVTGDVLDVDTIREPRLASMIANGMAQMHCIRDEENGRTPAAQLLPKLLKMFDNLPENFEDQAKNVRYHKEFPTRDQLMHEFISISSKVELLNSRVVFCHNDLLVKNVIYDPTEDKMAFIDYEYAGYNFQGYDIGNHFDEYAGVDDIDFSRFPNEKYQKWWIGEYLRYYHEFNGLQKPTEDDVQRLYVEANIFAPVAHFFWAIWAIGQAYYSTIDFDFMQYGINRMNEYKNLKARLWDLI